MSVTGPAPVIGVVMTCHNRREATVSCLASLDAAARAASVREDMKLFAVDDGSTDGTGEAIAAAWPGATVIRGSGELFWARGMALAERTALAGGSAPALTHLLWLNDDVVLEPDSLAVLLREASAAPHDVIVGALGDATGTPSPTPTYSGIRLDGGWHPLRFERVTPGRGPIAVDAMNGNLVLVPIGLARRVGGIDGGFSHAFADFDYAIRCREAGARVLLAPGVLGTCPRNGPTPPGSTFGDRRRAITDRKGRAVADQWRYLRRHGSTASLLLVAVPYVQFLAGEIASIPLIGRLVPRRALERSLR